MIPYGRQDIQQSDIDAVISVLKSDFLTQGPAIPAFEQALAYEVKAKHGVAVNSATSALHIACAALNLGQGDWLWTSPLTFVASANCGLYCGAQIDFVDVDPKTYNMCPKRLREKLEKAKSTGHLPKIVVPVHLCGQPCDMAAIHELSQQYGFYVIEDASHAVGGTYQGEPIGNCQYSDITVFSFHPVKIVTTGEGGMAMCNDPDIAHRMRLLRSHGITRDEGYMTHSPDGPWYYQQIDLGWNYRMTEIQAALGLSQIMRLKSYVKKRHELAAIYDERLGAMPHIKCPWQHPNSYSGYHLYVIRLDLTKCNKTHKEAFEFLRCNGIGVNLHYIPVHMQPYYLNMGFKMGDFPEAEKYYSQAISIPLFPNLSKQNQDIVIKLLGDLSW